MAFNPKEATKHVSIPSVPSNPIASQKLSLLYSDLEYTSAPVISGISASRIWNLTVADLSILELYTGVLSRVIEYKPITWYTILRLMIELEDIIHCQDQLTRITTVHPRSTNETIRSNLGNDEDSVSVPSDDDALSELDQAMIRSTQKRSMLPNVMVTALEALDRLVVTLAEEKELNLSTDTSLIHIL